MHFGKCRINGKLKAVGLEEKRERLLDASELFDLLEQLCTAF